MRDETKGNRTEDVRFLAGGQVAYRILFGGWRIIPRDVVEQIRARKPEEPKDPQCSHPRCKNPAVTIHESFRVIGGRSRPARYPRCEKHPLGNARRRYPVGEEP